MKKPRFYSWQIPLTVTFLIFGFLITTQYHTQVALSSSLESQSANDLSMLVISLSEKKDSVEAELASLQKDLRSIEDKTQAGQSLAVTLENQIKQLQMINGQTAVEGPGISVTITGDPHLMYYDLIDLVNELFVSEAEAVSINDIRIKSTTFISETEDNYGNLDITVDGKRLLSPIVIKAIGKPDTLETGLTFSGGIISNLNVLYHIYPIVKQEVSLHIPAADIKPHYYMTKPDSNAEKNIGEKKALPINE